jgi:pimeloyl-ACP methyl ester carboxylesterase
VNRQAAWSKGRRTGGRQRRRQGRLERAPTLIGAGTEDVVIPPANGDLLADALRDARLQLFEGGNHAFMAHERERVSALINSWSTCSARSRYPFGGR